MKFKSVAEAFNYYRTHSIEQIERRAAQLKETIDTDPNADITSINIEIEGLKQAKENLQEQSQEQRSAWNPITGMNFAQPKPQGNVFESAEYRSAFYKTLLGQKLEDQEAQAYKRAMTIMDAERRADAFNTTTDSAAVLPTQTLNEVIGKARDMGGIIKEARAFNVPTRLTVPIGTPATKAAWHTQGAPVETEKLTTAAVTFANHELIKILSMSAAVKRMSIDAFESYLVDELTNSVLEAIAEALVNGEGSTKGEGMGVLEGVTWTANTNLVEYTTAPDYTDFAKMLGLLKRGYGRNAKFAMNNATLYNQVYTLTDENGRPLFVPDPRNDEIGRILGKDVVIDDYLEDGVILLGNWQYVGWNLAEGILLEASRESSFKSGLVDFRALAIADTQVLVPEAFVQLAEGA